MNTQNTKHNSTQSSEPKKLLQWRRKVLDLVEPVQKNRSYGLSIMTDETMYEIDSPLPFDNSRYRLWHEGDVNIVPLETMFSDEGLAQKYFDSLESAQQYLSAHANSGRHGALHTGGWCFYAQASQQCRVHIATSFRNKECDLVFVYAAAGSHMSIVDESHSTEGKSARTIILLAEEGAIIDYVHDIENGAFHHTAVVPIIKKDASVTYRTSGCSSNGSILVRMDALLLDRGAHAFVYNALVASGRGMVDVYNYAHHRASYTYSQLHAAGAVGDHARLIYRSDIHMQEEGTQSMSGYQNARFVSVSPNAEVDAIPSLDIGRQDVACSHSVSVSFLKESDTFYPRSRGLSVSDAKTLMLEGILANQISNLSYMKDALYERLQSRLGSIVSK